MVVSTIEVDDDQIRALVTRLYAILQPDDSSAAAVLGRVEDAVSKRLLYSMSNYPEQSNAPMADLWTDKQRRWFFAALARGEIQVPYRRTGRLARSVAFKFDDLLNGYDAIFSLYVPENSPAAGYAEYVFGLPYEQSTYFRERTAWDPLARQIPLLNIEDYLIEAVRVALMDELEALQG